jgi:outer membrane receptor protein involved in Fe transport
VGGHRQDVGINRYFGNLVAIAARQHTDSYAGYTQTTFEVAPETHFTAGVRYTDDRRSIGGTTSAEGVGVLASGAQSAEFNKVTWRLALDHQFTPEVLGYVSDNRGFKIRCVQHVRIHSARGETGGVGRV